MPACIVYILSNRFSKSSTCVYWYGFRSSIVFLQSGVRQGGFLSPILFAVYVDDLFQMLEESKLGCFVQEYCINSLMYADDLINIAISVTDLKLLLQLSILTLLTCQ